MTDQQLTAFAERFLGAWNTQDVEAVVACYSPDLLYRDPNTRGEVRGADGLRRYLRKLFGAWTMHWSLREGFALAQGQGAAVLWRARLAPAGSSEAVEVDGMDLVLLRGELILRNEVYFDRAALAGLAK